MITDYDLEVVFEYMGSRLGRNGSGGNRKASCPLAPWTHQKGHDKSQGCMVKAGDVAMFRCFGCGKQGTVYTLAKLYAEYSGNAHALEFLRDKLKFEKSSVEFGAYQKKLGQKISRQVHIMKEEDLEPFLKQVPVGYASERGIDKSQLIRWEIGYDPNEVRMIFPIRNRLGKLMGVSGRAMMDEVEPRYKHYFGLQKERVLYGEHFIVQNEVRAYVVEGFFDVLILEKHGLKNVLGTMGTSLSEPQAYTLKSFQEVIFVPDFDDEGQGLEFFETHAQTIHRSGTRVGIAGVRQKKNCDSYVDCKYEPIDSLNKKDPGQFSKEDLKIALDHVCWL